MADHRYQQVTDALRGRIESGEFRLGDQLPTELALREQYNASRNTVRDALQMLSTQGYVEIRKGQGWFAARPGTPPLITVPADQKDGLIGIEGESAFAAIRSQGRSPSVSGVRVEVQAAQLDTATLLEVPVSSSVITRHQSWYVDKLPWSLQATAYSRELAARAPALLIDDDISRGAVAYIEQETGIKELGHHDLIKSRQPSQQESLFFQLPEGAHSPITVVTRTGYRAAGADLVPLRVTTTVFLADHAQFAVSSGLVPHEQRTAMGEEGSRASSAQGRPAGRAPSR
jgi:GntR family transcriptional regulator